MKFLIYSSDQAPQSKLEIAKKILASLYRSGEFETRTTKVYTSTIKKAVEDGVFVVDVTSKKSRTDGVLNLDLKKQTDEFLHDIITHIEVGISEKSVVDTINLANRELKRINNGS